MKRNKLEGEKFGASKRKSTTFYEEQPIAKRTTRSSSRSTEQQSNSRKKEEDASDHGKKKSKTLQMTALRSPLIRTTSTLNLNMGDSMPQMTTASEKPRIIRGSIASIKNKKIFSQLEAAIAAARAEVTAARAKISIPLLETEGHPARDIPCAPSTSMRTARDFVRAPSTSPTAAVHDLSRAPLTSMTARDIMCAPSAAAAARDFVRAPSIATTARDIMRAPSAAAAAHDFVRAPSTSMTTAAHDIPCAPSTSTATARDFVRAPSTATTARDFVRAPSTAAPAHDLVRAPSTSPTAAVLDLPRVPSTSMTTAAHNIPCAPSTSMRTARDFVRAPSTSPTAAVLDLPCAPSTSMTTARDFVRAPSTAATAHDLVCAPSAAVAARDFVRASSIPATAAAHNLRCAALTSTTTTAYGVLRAPSASMAPAHSCARAASVPVVATARNFVRAHPTPAVISACDFMYAPLISTAAKACDLRRTPLTSTTTAPYFVRALSVPAVAIEYNFMSRDFVRVPSTPAAAAAAHDFHRAPLTSTTAARYLVHKLSAPARAAERNFIHAPSTSAVAAAAHDFVYTSSAAATTAVPNFLHVPSHPTTNEFMRPPSTSKEVTRDFAHPSSTAPYEFLENTDVMINTMNYDKNYVEPNDDVNLENDLLEPEYRNDDQENIQYENMRDECNDRLHSTNRIQGNNQLHFSTGSNDVAMSIANALHSTLATIRETSLNSENSKLMNRISNIKSLPKFSGDPLDWTRFKQAYDFSTEAGGYSDRENVIRIFESLRGEARDVSKALFAGGNTAKEIMMSLEARFGNPRIILNKIIEEIRELPSISSRKMSIIEFAPRVKNAVTAIKSLDFKGHLYNSDLANQLLQKLTRSMYEQYVRFASLQDKDKPDLEKIADFLHNESQMTLNAGIIPLNMYDSYHKNDKNEKRSIRKYNEKTVLNINSRFDATKHKNTQCAYCGVKSHDVASCRDFSHAPTAMRWKVVRSQRLCYKCLSTGHSRDYCKAENCKLCKQKHNTLLHYTGNVPQKSSCEQSSPQDIGHSSHEQQRQKAKSNLNTVANTSAPDL